MAKAAQRPHRGVPKAKAQMRARTVRHNARRKHRRKAVTDLNTLAGECGLLSSQLAVTTATPAGVERLVRLLEARCSGAKQQRLRTTAKLWEDNGGVLT